VQSVMVMEEGHNRCLEEISEEGAGWCVGVCWVPDVVVDVSCADGRVGSLMVEECVEEVSSEEASRTQSVHCWVLELVLLSSPIRLVECAFQPVVSVYLVTLRGYVVGEGLR
jgi:hypothetical protein